MASYNQPESFWVEWIAATEIPASGMQIEPANIVQVGDNLKLRAIKVGGGAITKLTSVDSQMAADGWTGWWYGSNDLVYRSENTVDITTGAYGSGKTLELPTAAALEGTWQVLVVLNGGAGSGVCAFSSDMFVQIVK
jgi:hypothetical protein